MRRTPLVLTLALLLTCDSPNPTAPASDDAPPSMMGAPSPNVTITLLPPVAYLEERDTLRFTATIVSDGDTLDVAVHWFVTDTMKAQVDHEGLVTAREDGFAVLVAMWGGGLGAAAVVVDTPPPVEVTFRSGLIMQQVRGAHPFVAGRPVLARRIMTADRENDWEPTGIVELLTWPGPRRDTLPMNSPTGGIPVELAWDDWKHLDSSFHAVIPGDSVTAEGLHVGVDWNIDDDNGSSGYGADVVEVPDFHLVIVPVIWDSIPDYQIVEDTDGITADSFKIVEVQQMLPVRPGYQVTVLDPFTTKQDLTNRRGWGGLLQEIDSIRRTDGRRAYYYGAVSLPRNTAVGGMAWLNRPVSVGALWALTHELGHNMGLLHAPCGGPSSIDPEYPYENGLIGQGGFDFFWNETLKDPTEFYDVMSYCRPWWISDFFFNKALTHRLERESLWWDAAVEWGPPEIIADPLVPGWEDSHQR